MPNGKPNILILWGDDIGWWNISFNSRGQMGYRTPNIDRVANEGIAFTDYYAQQSCTAGRAAFITGQNPIRTGMTKVGMPGADVGLQPEDPTLAEMLKPQGYVTGQFGKNHLGDMNKYRRPCTVSTSSSATSITSTPKRSRSSPTTPRTRPSRHALAPEVSCTLGRPTWTIRP